MINENVDGACSEILKENFETELKNWRRPDKTDNTNPSHSSVRSWKFLSNYDQINFD